MANAIQKSPRQLLETRLPNMLSVVPESERERFRLAAYAVCINQTYADCTPESVLSSIFYCFRWGFEPDPARKQVYIVPFKDRGVKKAQPILGYNGLIDLARNADPSLVVRTGCVYGNDEFQFTDGTERRLVIFKPHWLKGEAPGRMLFSWCAYKVATQADFEIVVVPATKLEALRDKQVQRGGGQTWGSPDNYPAMCEKTAIRQAAKKWTLAPHTEAGKRLRQAVSDDEMNDDGLPELDTSDPSERTPQHGTAAVAAALQQRKAPEPSKDTPAPPTPPSGPAAPAEAPQAQADNYDPSILDDAPAADGNDLDLAAQAVAGLPWEDFVTATIQEAGASPLNAVKADDLLAGISKRVLIWGKKGKENSISQQHRKELYEAAVSGRLTADGKIAPAK